MSLDRREFILSISGLTALKAGETPMSVLSRSLENQLRRKANRSFGRTRAALKLREPLVIVYDTQLFGIEWPNDDRQPTLFVSAPKPLNVSEATDVAIRLASGLGAKYSQLNFPAFLRRGRIRV